MTVQSMGVAMLRANSNVGSKGPNHEFSGCARARMGCTVLVLAVAGGLSTHVRITWLPESCAAALRLQCGYDISVTHCDKSVTSLVTSCFCTSGVRKCPADEVLTCVAAAAKEAGSGLVDSGVSTTTVRPSGSQGQTSSCPYIYAWNGSGFDYQDGPRGRGVGLPSYSASIRNPFLSPSTRRQAADCAIQCLVRESPFGFAKRFPRIRTSIEQYVKVNE